MSTALDIAVTVLGALSALVVAVGSPIVWFKLRPEIQRLRAETDKVDVDAAVAESSAADEHWKSLLEAQAAVTKAQTEELLGPLRDEVAALRTDVKNLRTEIEQLRTRYWRAIGYIRLLIEQWGDPAIPPAPTDVASDL